MFGSKIKIDKDLLEKVKRYSRIAGYSSVDKEADRNYYFI